MTLTFGRSLLKEDGDGVLDVEIVDGLIVGASIYVEALGYSVQFSVSKITDKQVEQIMNVYWAAITAQEGQ